MPPKRPAGLGAASKAKKNKQDESKNEDTSVQVQPTAAQDDEDGDNWADLVELWEKCSNSLQSGEPASSAPLLRGVLHETSRLGNMHGSDLSGFLTENDNGQKSQVPLSHFRLILASAMLELGILIAASSHLGAGKSLAATGEPKTGTPFFSRAYSVAQTIEDSAFSKDSEIVAGRAAAEYLKERLESEPEDDADDELKHESKEQILTIAKESLVKGDMGSRSSSLLLSIGSLLSTLEEEIIDLNSPSTAVVAFTSALKAAENTQAKFESLVGKARVLVSRGSYVMDKIFDEEDTFGDEDVEEYIKAVKNELGEAISSLEDAQNMTDDIDVGEEEAEELTSLHKEAMIVLANLLPEGKEQEELFNKAGVEDDEDFRGDPRECILQEHIAQLYHNLFVMTSILRNGKKLQIPSIPKPKKSSNQKEYTHDQAVELVASFLTQDIARGKTAILSGAGASVESGIRSYRGKEGHYELHKKYRPIFYHEFIEDSDQGRLFRQRYWARSFFGYIPVQNAKPNRVHYSVAALQYMNLVDKLVTQNVDRLHHRATPESLNPDSRILELHGTLNFAVVPSHPNHPKKLRSDLQAELAALNPSWAEFADSQAKLKQNPDGDVELPSGLTYETFKVPPPDGLEGDRSAFYKPDVVFFGETLSPHQKEESIKAIEDADRVLVVGSSLATYSAFRLIKQAIESKKQVLMLNVGPSRADDYDITKIELPAADVLQGAVKLLASKLPHDDMLSKLSSSGVNISIEDIGPMPDPEATEAK
ncbi:hypothetical protein E3P81_00016 [Wallemia ichthyophaga]|nr:hypothetical protein E3P97_00152 [Wallemia ichthyophaga]TIB36251.1 hypothetical protein E3P85_00016 [Wallemia ichthyophaga]TIB51464.1 hypothetical protein E3P82_00152 [Wallemia ichthyophaga]TIB54730.1 hypothetical protein E3P81_00016 [Wallemia ichthyophaga]TIB57317.1 hypothetical protein E3P80_00152 [Wallemia ichthyophaga]